MAILSTNQKLIKVDVGYSAGNGIDITSGVISVTGDNAPYSAGQNIYFDGDDNHVINGKDWGNEINEATANAFNEASAWVAQNYANSADLTYLSGVVDNKLDASAWSSVSADMATEQYVIANGNVVFGRTTGWVNDQNYSTVSQLESVSSDLNTNKLDASSYHELTAGENIDIQNYIISSKDWTNEIQNSSANAYNESTGYVNNWIEETYSTDKNALSAAIDYVSANAGDQEVNSLVHSNSGEWNNVSAKLDTTAYTPFDPSYMSGAIDEKLDTTAFSTVSGDFLTAIPDEYATKDFVSNSITGKLDISSFSAVSGDFLTNEDLNGYATESFVENVSGEITELIPTDYATTATTNTLSEQIEELSGTISSAQTLSAGVGVSFYEDEVNNITRIDCTATGDYATTSEVESISSMLSGAIDYVSANAGDEFPVSADEAIQYVQTNSANIDETVTSYQTNSGTFLTAHQAISAEEWNGCYDNVTTNSGAWGGSALPISAGPGIKVNLVDNTLVFSNDETVLYSGYENVGNDGAATYNLTELPTNFNKIKIYWCLRNDTQFEQGNKGVGSVEYDTNLYSADYTYIAGFMEGASDNTVFEPYRYDANIAHIRTTAWTQNGQLTRLVNNQVLENNAQWFHIYKIIGINRIAGGN